MYSEQTLTPDEISRATASVFALSNHWTSRAPEPLASYTLGAATYLDGTRHPRIYEEMYKKKNPLLIEHFTWLYQKIIQTMSKKWGDIKIHPELAHPGFHIFGAPPGELISEDGCRLMEQPLASVHVDAPYRAHMAQWNFFKTVNFLNPLSITLCLSLPQSGGGLNMWQAIDKKTMINGHEMIDCQFNRHHLNEYKYIAYQPGHIYISSGHHIHQIAPAKPMRPEDRRITLQAHAVNCDGVWQLFF